MQWEEPRRLDQVTRIHFNQNLEQEYPGEKMLASIVLGTLDTAVDPF